MRIITLVAPDRLDEWLQTVRATGGEPSAVAEAVAQLNRTQPAARRAVAAWHWHRRFGAAAKHARKN